MYSALLLLTAVSGEQQVLDRISTDCGLSAGDIMLQHGRLVRVRLKGTPSYAALKCAFAKLKQRNFTYPIGFISEPPVGRKK